MYISTQNGHSLLVATLLVETESRNTKVGFPKDTWQWWQAIAPHPIPLPCALALLSPSHRDAALPSPCWALHFMTQERLMFSNPTRASRASLPPRRWATTCSRLSLNSCPAPLSCSLQPLVKLSLLRLGPFLLQFVSIVALLLNHRNPIFEPVCVFIFSSSAFAFWWKWKSALSPCLQFGRYHHSDSTITFTQALV